MFSYCFFVSCHGRKWPSTSCSTARNTCTCGLLAAILGGEFIMEKLDFLYVGFHCKVKPIIPDLGYLPYPCGKSLLVVYCCLALRDLQPFLQVDISSVLLAFAHFNTEYKILFLPIQ